MGSLAATTQPGGNLIYGMPFEDYVTLEGVHATGLKEIAVSPRLYWRKRQRPHEDKDALRLGRATHTAVLEPDRFALEHAVWRARDGRRGTKAHKAFCAANTGRTMLTEAQYATALAVRDAVRGHGPARALLDRCRPEVTAQWVHARTGRKCVSRFDLLGDVLVDLKTTRNPSPAKFSYDAKRLGYPLQMGFYLDAALACTGRLPRVKIIAAQNVEPFDVAVFDLPDEVLIYGREQYELALDKLIECEASGVWPGIAPDEEVTLHLPAGTIAEDGPDESRPIEDVDF